jgi:4'-phosphopantetheinyl transferase
VSATTPVVKAMAAAPVRASGGRVDVWQVSLQAGSNEAALRSLSEPERRFAARLRVGAGAWVGARAALRCVLGRYLGLDPGRVVLETGANGKPRLAGAATADLRFNLSHSGDVGLIAVRLGHEVGVDVEELRSGVDGAGITREVFAAFEHSRLPTPATEEPDAMFFRSWVRREALAKATGRGIVSPPSPDDAARFTVRDLDGIAGFAAALASEGDDWRVRRVGPGDGPALGRRSAAPRRLLQAGRVIPGAQPG